MYASPSAACTDTTALCQTALTFSAMIRNCLGHSLRIVQETQTTSDTSHIPAQSPKSTALHEVNARLPCRCDFLDLAPRCALRDDTGLSRVTPISYPDLTLPATPCCNCNVVLATFPCCIESVVAASMKYSIRNAIAPPSLHYPSPATVLLTALHDASLLAPFSSPLPNALGSFSTSTNFISSHNPLG